MGGIAGPLALGCGQVLLLGCPKINRTLDVHARAGRQNLETGIATVESCGLRLGTIRTGVTLSDGLLERTLNSNLLESRVPDHGVKVLLLVHAILSDDALQRFAVELNVLVEHGTAQLLQLRLTGGHDLVLTQRNRGLSDDGSISAAQRNTQLRVLGGRSRRRCGVTTNQQHSSQWGCKQFRKFGHRSSPLVLTRTLTSKTPIR